MIVVKHMFDKLLLSNKKKIIGVHLGANILMCLVRRERRKNDLANRVPLD